MAKRLYVLLGKNGYYLYPQKGLFIGDKNTKLYGRVECPYVFKDKKENKEVVFFLQEHDTIELGYRPCVYCLKKFKKN